MKIDDIDPRLRALIDSNPTVDAITRWAAASGMDEREMLIEMVLALGTDNKRLFDLVVEHMQRAPTRVVPGSG